MENFELRTKATKNILDLIEILKQWRSTLWKSASDNSTSFLVPVLDDFSQMQEVAENAKQFIDNEIYERFNSELAKTIYLLRRCLTKSLNLGYLSNEREEEIKILVSKLSSKEDAFENKELIVTELRDEDPTIKDTLKGYGLSKEEIDKMIAAGFTVETVLDIVPASETRK